MMSLHAGQDNLPSESTPLAYTIVTRSHFFLAAGLAVNFRQANPAGRFLIVVADADDPTTGEADWEWLAPQHRHWLDSVSTDMPLSNQNLRSAQQLCRLDHWNLAFQYSPLELTCCLKGRVAASLLRNGEQQLLYLDADTRIFDSVPNCLAPLQRTGGVLLTPHLRRPLPQDSCYPNNIDLLRSGVFNGGVLGFVQQPKPENSVFDFLDWWNQCNHRDCIVDPHQGLFVDQKWLDQAPAYFASVQISRNPGLNVGYWNLHERRIEQQNEDWIVTDRCGPEFSGKLNWKPSATPLQIFHFSGASRVASDGSNACHRLSRHQNRHPLKSLGGTQNLLEGYLASWEQHAWLDYQGIPYRYDKLSNGLEITRQWKEAFRLNSCQIREVGDNPFVDFSNARVLARLEAAANVKHLKSGRFQYHLDGLQARIDNLKYRLDQLPWRRLLRATQSLQKRWFRKAG
ncbi:MAG: hypothetical protein JNL67_10825 [Planctomycetaceae bacterium]|nr:hypothetical protein [Planctomycetaceae bacterium]